MVLQQHIAIDPQKGADLASPIRSEATAAGNISCPPESQKWKNRNGGWRLNRPIGASNLPVDGDLSTWIAAGRLEVTKGNQSRNCWAPSHA